MSSRLGFVLAVLSYHVAMAINPSFNCGDGCTVKPQTKKKTYYMVTDNASPTTVVLDGSTKYEVAFPLKYSSFDLTIDGALVPYTDIFDGSFNPYTQTSHQKWYEATSVAPVTLVMTATSSTKIRWSVTVGTDEDWPIVQIILLPLTLLHLHGYYWTNQYYIWIFGAVTYSLTTIYVVLRRVRPWQFFIVYAMATFVACACDKIYHIIITQTRTPNTLNCVYAILVITLCAEGLPFLYCVFFMYNGKCQPIRWSLLAMMIAAGFLFVFGSGCFFGIGFLFLGGLTFTAIRLR